MNSTRLQAFSALALYLAAADAAAQPAAEGQVGVSAEADVSAQPDPIAAPVAPPPPAAPAAPTPAPLVPAADAWSEKARTLGVGGDLTLGGTVGLHARYFFSPAIAFQLTVGYASLSTTIEPEGGGEDTETKSSTFVVGLGGIYRLFGWDEGLLALTLGIDISSTSSETQQAPFPDVEASSTAFGGSVGLHAELFLADFLSVHGQTGLRVATSSGEQGDNDTSGFQLSLGGDALAGFGFTFWMI